MRVLLLCLAACAAPRPVVVADRISPVEVTSWEGTPTTLGARAAGRPMVVDLFATWCDTCREQIPALNQLARKHGERLLVIGVDVGERRSEVETQLRNFGIEYPVVFDAEFRFADSLGVSQLPMMLLVDRDGVIRHRARTLDAASAKAIDELVGP